MLESRLIPALYPAMAFATVSAVLYGCALAGPPEASSVVYRIRYDAQAADPIAGPGVAVVAGAAPADVSGAERLYRTAIGSPARLPAGYFEAAILAAGPMLDGPDQVVAMPGAWHGRRFEVEVRHTSANLSGKPLLRNVPWRPLVAIPLTGIPAGGVCEVVVRWQPVESLPDGKPLAQPLVSTASFQVE
jgi:hypothetical protein